MLSAPICRNGNSANNFWGSLSVGERQVIKLLTKIVLAIYKERIVFGVGMGGGSKCESDEMT